MVDNEGKVTTVQIMKLTQELKEMKKQLVKQGATDFKPFGVVKGSRCLFPDATGFQFIWKGKELALAKECGEWKIMQDRTKELINACNSSK